MRPTIIAALLALAACATAERKPAGAAPAAPAAAEPPPPAQPGAPAPGALATVELASATATRAGAALRDTRYSERPDDAAITARTFEDGVVTYAGQVGLGKGSAYAGIGLWAPLRADEAPVDLTAATAVTFRLASPTTRTLRLRIAGPEKEIQEAGCYPVHMQAITPELREYTIPVSAFAAEGWCGAKARTTAQTLPQVIGFEVADIAIRSAPTSVSVGTITVR